MSGRLIFGFAHPQWPCTIGKIHFAQASWRENRCLQPQQRPMLRSRSNRGRSCPNWPSSLRRGPAAFPQRPARTSYRAGHQRLRHVRKVPPSLVGFGGVSPSPRLLLPGFPVTRQVHSRHLRHCGIPQDRVDFQSCPVIRAIRSEGAAIRGENSGNVYARRGPDGNRDETALDASRLCWTAMRISASAEQRKDRRKWTTTGFLAISFSAPER